MGRKETGFFERLINAVTGTGTTVTRTTDFWGKPKTIVHNYDTNTTKEYTHHQGFWGNRTDVKVKRNGEIASRGTIRKNFWGQDVMSMEHKKGKVRKSVTWMNTGFFGNHDQTCQYDNYGRKIGGRNGRKGLIFNTYTLEYTGECFCCNGTGIYKRTGKPCRKCGGTGVYRRKK